MAVNEIKLYNANKSRLTNTKSNFKIFTIVLFENLSYTQYILIRIYNNYKPNI